MESRTTTKYLYMYICIYSKNIYKAIIYQNTFICIYIYIYICIYIYIDLYLYTCHLFKVKDD